MSGFEPADAPGAYNLVHRSGDTLDSDRFVGWGVVDEAALTGQQLTAGQSVVGGSEETGSTEGLRPTTETERQTASSLRG